MPEYTINDRIAIYTCYIAAPIAMAGCLASSEELLATCLITAILGFAGASFYPLRR